MKLYNVIVDEYVAVSHYLEVEAESEEDALERVKKVVERGDTDEGCVYTLSDGRLWEVEGIESLGERTYEDLSKVSYDVGEAS